MWHFKAELLLDLVSEFIGAVDYASLTICSILVRHPHRLDLWLGAEEFVRHFKLLKTVENANNRAWPLPEDVGLDTASQKHLLHVLNHLTKGRPSRVYQSLYLLEVMEVNS